LFLNGSDQELTDYFISKFEDEVEENKRNEIWRQYAYLYNLDFDCDLSAHDWDNSLFCY
jgi:hypothetical protein